MSVEYVFEIEDASGDRSTTQVRVASVASVTQLNAFGAGWATALNNLIAGKIISAFAYQLCNISSIVSNILSGNADVEHVGKFEFLTSFGTRVKVNIPALSEVAIGATTSDSLDQAQADVAAFIAAMTSGISVTGATIQPCDVGEKDISDVIFARESFRNSGARR